MSSTSPHTLSLSSNTIAQHLADPSPSAAQALGSLITNSKSTSDLNTVLITLTQQFILQAHAHPSQIDSLLSFLALIASHIPSTLSHPGSPQLNDEGQQLYKQTYLRPAQGVDILAERLSKTLFDSLWENTSRAYTPDEETDKQLPKKYYTDSCVLGIVLARAFALNNPQTLFRKALWREVEDVLVKSLFSPGSDPEPGSFVVLVALLQGAGTEIRAWLGTNGHCGHGKNWVWYDDRRASQEEWGWADVVEASKQLESAGIDEKVASYVRVSFGRARRHVGDGGGDMASSGSERLVKETFGWVNDQE